jgi:hypothetical protein
MMVTGYHKVAFPLLMVVLVWTVVAMVRDFSVDGLMAFLAVVALLFVGFYARVFALGVQDRVIRLEERLRMERILPEELRTRIMEITTDQLIGLRFAPDDELPALVQRVLGGSLKNRKEIKAAIKNWNADNQRI